MRQAATFLVFGGTGGTGKHFVAQALKEGHKVRVLARDPAKLALQHVNLLIRKGSIMDAVDLDALVRECDFVVSMLGDVKLQKDAKINTAFVKKLVPAMRRQGVKRFLYQAGGLKHAVQGASVARPLDNQAFRCARLRGPA